MSSVGKTVGDGADTKMAENVSTLEQVLSQRKGELFCHSVVNFCKPKTEVRSVYKLSTKLEYMS